MSSSTASRRKPASLRQTSWRGKHIVTVEGLSAFEKEAFTYAFGEAGAVQCGFCIPGMVISAKGLIDQTPDPTREEAAFAIRNNICRCTGYVKIIDGILLAAKILREGKIPEKKEDFQVGSRVHRIDVAEKVQGYGKYPDDIYVDGMCYGGAVRSQYPRARVLYIRTKEAEALPRRRMRADGKGHPGQQNVGHIQKDQPTLIGEGEITQYLGDAVALVCARDLETLEQAKSLYVSFTKSFPRSTGLRRRPPPVRPRSSWATAAICRRTATLCAAMQTRPSNIPNTSYTRSLRLRGRSTPFLEPECCVALPLENGGVKLLTTDQSAHTTQHECSAMLGVGFAHCQVENMLVGGGFGGKEDMSVQHHAALIAYIARVPVKVKLTRQGIAARPSQAPSDVDGLHDGLRRKRHHSGRKGERRVRHGRLRLTRRPRARARVHARRGPVSL